MSEVQDPSGRRGLAPAWSSTSVERIVGGVPGYRSHNQGRDCSTIEKGIVADRSRDVVLQHIRFEPRRPGDLRVFVLLAPFVDSGRHTSGFDGTLEEWRIPFATERFVADLATAALDLGDIAPFGSCWSEAEPREGLREISPADARLRASSRAP